MCVYVCVCPGLGAYLSERWKHLTKNPYFFIRFLCVKWTFFYQVCVCKIDLLIRFVCVDVTCAPGR